MKKLCVVIGMGRSGTSMLSGILEILGVNFGDTIWKGGNIYNAKGYWEDPNVLLTSEGLIGKLGLQPEPQWLKDAKQKPFPKWLYPAEYDFSNPPKSYLENKDENAIFTFFTNLAKKGDLVGVKDPRLTLLLPLYEYVWRKVQLDVHYIFIKRNPEEVAKSLYKFHDYKMPREHALGLCERYNRDAEKFAGTKKIYRVDYGNLVKNAVDIATEMATFLGVEYTDDKKQKVFEFVDPSLHRNRA